METQASPNERSRACDSDTESTHPLKSNLKLRSNLFPSIGKYKTRLHRQISGAPALKKYLAEVTPRTEFAAAARKHLQPWQQAQLAYELPCSECGATPEGPVRTASGLELQFRCPRGLCQDSRSFARTVDLGVALIERVRQRFGGDVSMIASSALCKWSHAVGEGSSPLAPTTQRPIRMSRTQHYLYRFETLPRLSAIVNACLLKLLEE